MHRHAGLKVCSLYDIYGLYMLLSRVLAKMYVCTYALKF